MKHRKHLKHYTLSSSLVAEFEALPTTRSASMRAAVTEAANDDQVLASALVQRLVSPKDDSGVARIAVSWDDDSEEKLNKLADRASLPIEHVLRLAMEAYISRRKGRHSHKESDNATAGGLLHDGERST